MNQPSTLRGNLRVMQIVGAAMIAGALVFAAIAIILPDAHAAPKVQPSLVLTSIAIIWPVAAILLAILWPSMIRQKALRQIADGTWSALSSGFPARGSFATRRPAELDRLEFATDESKLLAVRQQTWILRIATLEGAVFLCLIAYMIERHPAILAVAVVLVIGMALSFPTESRVRQWLTDSSRRIDDLRALSG